MAWLPGDPGLRWDYITRSVLDQARRLSRRALEYQVNAGEVLQLGHDDGRLTWGAQAVNVGAGIDRRTYFVALSAPFGDGVQDGQRRGFPVHQRRRRSHHDRVHHQAVEFDDLGQAGEIALEEGLSASGQASRRVGDTSGLERAGGSQPMAFRRSGRLGRLADDRHQVDEWPVLPGRQRDGEGRFVSVAGNPFDEAAPDRSACRSRAAACQARERCFIQRQPAQGFPVPIRRVASPSPIELIR